jgi:hypothetical protein
MKTDQTLAAVVIVGILLFAGHALSRVDACRQIGDKSITCAIGFE